MGKTKITPHFTFEEMTTTDHSEFKESVELLGKQKLEELTALCWHLEAIRAIIGSPLTITSAVRSKELNSAIKGSKTSQHLVVEAADFIPTKKSAIMAFSEIVKSGYPFGQLILEKRGLGYLIHFGIGNKRETLFSAKQGNYEPYDVSKVGA